jgi:ankyrin repeat protein
VAGNVLFASEVNQLDVLQSCLTIDSDCVNNTFYNNGRNALWLAVNSGRPEAARLLLQHGANPDAEDDVGESARLHLSILTLGQIHQPEVIRELNQLISISTGVDELEHLSKVILGLRVGDVKSLLQQDDPSARAALNNIDGLGHSALHYAVMRGNPDVVFDLIKAGAYVNIQSLGGLTPLACAACFQLGESCIDVLMDHGADPSILSKDTWSPLMTACFFNRAKVVQRLVARGANVNEASRDGIMSTGAHLAMINDAVEVVEYLTTVDDINWSAREADGGTPFLTTLKVRAPKCLKVLLRNGVDYSDVNDVGDSVLHLAARSGDSELIEILASHGLRGLHVQMRNYAGQTPQEVLRLQHPAALEEVENIFENLIQAVEANINVEADNNKEDVFYDAKDS